MKARIAGLGLWLLLLLPAAVAFAAMPLVIAFAPVTAAKGALRAFDVMVSAALFGGSPYMSLSAWSWFNAGQWWANAVIWITDRIDAGHAARAYLDEAPILALIQAHKEGRI